MANLTRKRRIPKLSYTANRGTGWFCSYRDPVTKKPKKKRFGDIPEAEAQQLYHTWLGEFLKGEDPPIPTKSRVAMHRPGGQGVQPELAHGCLIEVASGLLDYERSRVRGDHAPRARGSITHRHYLEIEQRVHKFLTFLNARYGQGAVRRLTVTDIAMRDVEDFNCLIVREGMSHSGVRKLMRQVKAIIDRAGRPEHGSQRLQWNWDSRDILHGVPATPRQLPTLDQLQRMLDATDLRGRTMIWMAIGLGFGQSDLTVIQPRHINAEAYDLRRGKTGMERYGATPPLVWQYVSEYLNEHPRDPDRLMFTTRHGQPLVRPNSDSVKSWWANLRLKVGETPQSLQGFYILRHLGATEFGSRPGCSIGEMKRWLGHSASSNVADVYMKPVSPESQEVVEYVRFCVNSVTFA